MEGLLLTYDSKAEAEAEVVFGGFLFVCPLGTNGLNNDLIWFFNFAHLFYRRLVRNSLPKKKEEEEYQ